MQAYFHFQSFAKIGKIRGKSEPNGEMLSRKLLKIVIRPGVASNADVK